MSRTPARQVYFNVVVVSPEPSGGTYVRVHAPSQHVVSERHKAPIRWRRWADSDSRHKLLKLPPNSPSIRGNEAAGEGGRSQSAPLCTVYLDSYKTKFGSVSCASERPLIRRALIQETLARDFMIWSGGGLPHSQPRRFELTWLNLTAPSSTHSSMP